MPKMPRNISGKKLSVLLRRYGYVNTRNTGDHMRLKSNHMEKDHNITIPSHSPLKIGTLNNILNDVAQYLNMTKRELMNELFR